MAKTAAQLVPLKTQLSGTMAIFRFADATTDFSGSVAYQSFPYDNAGLLGTPNGNSGAPAFSGTPVPAALLSAPAAPGVSLNAAGPANTTVGLNRYQTQSWYTVVFFDSSYRESQNMNVYANIPAGTAAGSVTFNFTWPPGAAGAMIYKPQNSNGFSAVLIPNTVTQYVDTSSYGQGSFNGATGVTTYTAYSYMSGAPYPVNRYPSPQPSSQSVAPAVSATNVAVIVNLTGGSFRSSGYSYALTSYNSLGETTIGLESATANSTGTPNIAGSTMTAITLATSTATGALPLGKYYYQVTAYTLFPGGSNQINTNNFSNSNATGNPITGAGGTESLPCVEVNATLTATGQINLAWTPVANAVGYVIYRSKDVSPPVLAAPTTATTGGTLPATTQYFYVVTATNANGETIASNEVNITTGAGATNTISLSWANVPHAYGYKVYRGTAAGTENALLSTITLGSTTTYVDTGTAGTAFTPPGTNTATGVGQEVYLSAVGGQASSAFNDTGLSIAQNSGFTPPKVYNGSWSSFTITPSWSAVAGAVGYNLYRNAPGLVTVQTNQHSNYSLVATTKVDDNVGVVSKYHPVFNWSGSNNINIVGRYVQVSNSAHVIDKFGATVSLVPGQQYRFYIYSQSANTNLYFGPTFTANSSALLYYEALSNYNNVSYLGQYLYFSIQGITAAATISWGANPKPTLPDNPTINIQSENNTWASALYANIGTLTTYQLGAASQDGRSPSQVYNEATSNLPMRISFRQSFSGSTINGVKGTMLGGARLPQFALSPNTTYATPVKSIVPNWSVLVPASPFNPTVFANRWIAVEVSSDGGSTFVPLTNQARYVFQTPATQLQYRYTVPQASATMSFDRRTQNQLPATDNAYLQTFNQGFTSDSGHYGYYYQTQSNQDNYLYSNGNMLVGNTYGNFQYNFYSFQNLATDVDMSMTCYFNQGGQIGLKWRHDGSGGSYGGFYAWLDSGGNWGVYRVTNSNSFTTLFTGSGATNGALNVSHVLRVICVGTHSQFFIDGFKVADIVDATAGQYQTGANVGISGQRGIAQSFQATALNTAQIVNTPPWELEFVSAYLET